MLFLPSADPISLLPQKKYALRRERAFEGFVRIVTGAGRSIAGVGIDAFGTFQRRFLLCYGREILAFIAVFLDPVRPFLGDLLLGEDGFDRAFGHAGIAIDADIRLM